MHVGQWLPRAGRSFTRSHYQMQIDALRRGVRDSQFHDGIRIVEKQAVES
jgi:hypothetical protein